MPSTKYSWAASPERLARGSTASDPIRRGAPDLPHPLLHPATASIAKVATTSAPAMVRRLRVYHGFGSGNGTVTGPLSSARRAKARSRADWNRCSRSFSRQRRTTVSTFGGIGTVAALSSAGWSRRIAASVSAAVSPLNARRPASISYSMHPRAKMSLRGSADSPRTCSGDMYPTVPSTVPGSVWTVTVVSPPRPSAITRAEVARPKSRILICPSRVMKTLPGFRSRWTIPLAWADESPSAINAANSIACRHDRRSRARRRSSDSPSSSSVTAQTVPSYLP